MEMGRLFAAPSRRVVLSYLGNALLTRCDILAYEVKPLVWTDDSTLPARTGNSLRNLVDVRMAFSDVEVRIFLTHLDRGPLRLQQLEQVLLEFRRHPHAILLGDLNTRRDASLLAEALDSGWATEAGSHGADYADNLDWILVRGFEVVGTGVHPRGVSDHPFFWASLRLEG